MRRIKLEEAGRQVVVLLIAFAPLDMAFTDKAETPAVRVGLGASGRVSLIHGPRQAAPQTTFRF